MDYPTSLSRGLVLVKSWLLALPQLVIVVVFGGIPVWLVQDLPWSLAAGGLLGLLTLVAVVVLLVIGRYPPTLFDLIMGLNRWVYRVLGYVLLMTDDYPPFRLDSGGRDPATSETRHPIVAEGASQPSRRTPADEQRSGVRLTIIGIVLVAAAFTMWWLVETTNPSGHHDAQLLPIFAAIPLALGLFRIFHARSRAHHHHQ